VGLCVAVLALALSARVTVAQQQDSVKVGARRAPAKARLSPDAIPPLSPGAAFLRSALVPGLGQASLDRPIAGAIFSTFEILSIALLRKAIYGLREAERYTGDSTLVLTWKTANGREVLDSLGRPIPDQTTPNKWTVGGLVSARKTFREDWIAALVFNHLISGVDAFVAAQLWDLPVQVSLVPSPRVGTTMVFTIRTR
jgi:hypothetical protein